MADAEDLTTLRLRIEGHVQAVGFRYYRDPGSAQTWFEWLGSQPVGRSSRSASVGSTKAIEAFVAACMRGPPGALVKNVDLHNAGPPSERGFHQLPSV